MASTKAQGQDVPVVASMIVAVVGLHVVGIVLLAVAAGRELRLSDGGYFGIGLGVTAYTLGMRHAFDADHIAAIDNTTRKLVGDGGRPLSVGFWFALGHSTVVMVLCLLLAVGVRSLLGQVQAASSTLQVGAGIIGSAVAGLFLLAMGLVNLVSLVRIVGLFRRMRDGDLDADVLEAELDGRGFMARVLRPVTRAVRRPRHMYPVGVLFGLGFDTATEIALLALAGGAAVALPWYAIASLPILFTAGMCLFDTIDGLFMRRAYSWAFERPVRAVYYNVAVTSLSVVVALVVGVIVLTGLVAERAGVQSGPVAFVADLDLGLAGYGMVALFIVVWVASTLAWKLFRIEQRWVRADRNTAADWE